jgi:ABC transport system ATP-binding/permease protein
LSILSTESLGHKYHDRWLFNDLFLGIEKGERIALVGTNGTGKSTLLKILAEVLAPSVGKVVKERFLKLGYLQQDPDFTGQATIADFIYSADNQQQQAVRKYEELLEQTHPDEKLLSQLTDDLSELNAWEYEYEIKTILSRLGITDLHQSINSLSGGQRKRLALAKLLIDEPDVYILDEPTNHLDIETIEWLESFLTTGQKTIVLVTHDRYFLDNVCQNIIELEHGKLFSYKGNYSYFLEKKDERLMAENAEYSKNSNLLRRELEWMRRQPKARSTKSKSRIGAFYDLEEKVQGKRTQDQLELSVRVSRQGNKILELEHLTKSFNDRIIISDFSYTFKKGDRIGISGKNGTGKSTLLNIITGALQADQGHVNVGETTVFGYYKQGGLDAGEDERVIDVVKNVAEYITMADNKILTASQLLTHFLFPPQKQHDKVSKLSGGEKKRLQLMRILMKNPNFLILDEPTNDLDIDTLNVLEDFLLKFNGILLLISHDRYLIDRLTEQLFIIEEKGHIRIYIGNYTDYRMEQEDKKQLAKDNLSVIKKPQLPIKKKVSFYEQKEYASVAKEIEEVEEKLKALTLQLNSDAQNHDELSKIAKKIKGLNIELEQKTNRWIELAELIES